MIRIAVCEDDYVYTEMIRSILQSCITVPYEVKFFSSGTEFLNTLTVLHEEHIFRGRLSKLLAGIRGVFSCLRNRDVKFRKRQKQIPDTG